MQNSSLKLHRITNAFYLIVILPFLLLGFFSALVMFNCKMAGGHPNLFGNYIVEVQNDNFYDEATGAFKAGSQQTFRVVDTDTLKPGDMIAYYSGRTGDTLVGTMPDWVPIDPSVNLEAGLGISARLGSSTEDPTTDGRASVSIVRVGEFRGQVRTTDGQVYDCISYYTENGGEEQKDSIEGLLFVVDVIGVAVDNAPVLVEFMVYSATFNGFLTFILLPCMFLVAMKIVSLWFYKRYMLTANFERQAQIITEGDGISYNKVLQTMQGGKAVRAPKGNGGSLWDKIQPVMTWTKKKKQDAPEMFKVEDLISAEPVLEQKVDGWSDEEAEGSAHKILARKKQKEKKQKEKRQKRADAGVLDIRPVTSDEYGKVSARQLRKDARAREKAKQEEFERLEKGRAFEDDLLAGELGKSEAILVGKAAKDATDRNKAVKQLREKRQKERKKEKTGKRGVFAPLLSQEFDEKEFLKTKKANLQEKAFMEAELAKSEQAMLGQYGKKPSKQKAKAQGAKAAPPTLQENGYDAIFATQKTHKPVKAQSVETTFVDKAIQKLAKKEQKRQQKALEKQIKESEERMLASMQGGQRGQKAREQTSAQIQAIEQRVLGRRRKKVDERKGEVPFPRPDKKFEAQMRTDKAHKESEIALMESLLAESQDKYLQSIQKKSRAQARKEAQKAMDDAVKGPARPAIRPTGPRPQMAARRPEQEKASGLWDELAKDASRIEMPKNIEKAASKVNEEEMLKATKYDLTSDLDGMGRWAKKRTKRADAKRAKKEAQAQAQRKWSEYSRNKRK